MDNKTLAFRIKKIREYRNYTQAYMAHKLGIRQNTYSGLESGNRRIKQERLTEITAILNVPENVFLNDNFSLFDPDVKSGIQVTKEKDEKETIIALLRDEIQHLRQENNELVKAIQHIQYPVATSDRA